MKTSEYGQLSTETQNPRSGQLDLMSTLEIVDLMNREDQQVLWAIGRARKWIARAVSLVAESLQNGGRLIFVGAGTSGRLGVIEAAECPPTFNTPEPMIQAIMAGGPRAVFRSKEGAEDSEKEAELALRRAGVRKGDVVVGVAASGVTPFVRAALKSARARHARAIFLTCNRRLMNVGADLTIALETGPEVLTGSTRLKAGTACKMVLNMLTTASMVRIGKVYRNYMVDLQPKSKKLVARGIRLIQHLGMVPEHRAAELFKESRGQVKIGILMARQGLARAQAQQRLKEAKGFLGRALNAS